MFSGGLIPLGGGFRLDRQGGIKTLESSRDHFTGELLAVSYELWVRTHCVRSALQVRNCKSKGYPQNSHKAWTWHTWFFCFSVQVQYETEMTELILLILLILSGFCSSCLSRPEPAHSATWETHKIIGVPNFSLDKFLTTCQEPCNIK